MTEGRKRTAGVCGRDSGGEEMRREWGRRRSADGGYRLILGRFLAAPDSLVVRVYPPYMPDNNGKVSLERGGGGKDRKRERTASRPAAPGVRIKSAETPSRLELINLRPRCRNRPSPRLHPPCFPTTRSWGASREPNRTHFDPVL